MDSEYVASPSAARANLGIADASVPNAAAWPIPRGRIRRESASVMTNPRSIVVCPRRTAPSAGRQPRPEPRINPVCVFLKDTLLVACRKRGVVDIAARIVVVLAGRGINAAHRADHLRSEQDVFNRDHLQQQ